MTDQTMTNIELLKEISVLKKKIKKLEKSEPQQKLTDMELNKSENKYRKLAEDMPALICTFLPDSTLTYVNKAYCELFQKQPEDLVGQKFLDFLPDDMTRENVRRQYLSLSPENPVKTYEHKVILSDGTNQYHWHRWTDRAFFSDDGQINYFQSIGQDITDRKRVEEALHESEGKHRLLFDNAGDAIFIHDTEARMLAVNPLAIERTGYTHAEMMSMTINQIDSPEEAPFAPDRIARLMEHGHLTFETVHQRKDGSLVPTEVSARRITWNGQPAMLSICRDITERKRIEEVLRENAGRLELAQSAGKSGIWDWDVVNGQIEWSSHMFNLFGLDKQKSMASFETWESALHPEDLEIAGQRIDNALKERIQLNSDYRIILPDGQIRWINAVGEGEYDIQGRPVRMLGVCIDITHRKLAEEELRESEERFRSMFRGHDAIMLLIDQKTGAIRDANQAAARFYGYSAERLCQMTIQEINTLDAEEVAHQRTLAIEEKRNYFIFPHRLASGEVKTVEVHSSPITIRGETILFSIIHDITDREQAEDALRDSEAKYRNIFENAMEGIYQSTPEGRFITANAALARMAGYDSPEELIAAIEDIGTQLYVHPEDRKRFLEIITTKGMVNYFEVEFYKKNGRIFWVVINARAVKDKQEKTLYYEGIVEDITLRKQAEQKLLHTLDNLRKSFSTTIQVLVSAVETRDPYTSGHQTRSADLARAIATEMCLSQKRIDGIRMAGSIHDIGKMSIPAEILVKPTKLSELEFSLIKDHAKKGFEMLKDVESPWPLAEIVYQHHERMDGSGYPRQLKGEEIIMEARILAVADVVEAMASHRPYRPAIGLDAALTEIENNKGALYDADAVDACLRLFREKGFQLVS